MARAGARLCPPPEPAESIYAELKQRFADDYQIKYAFRDGKITAHTPCVATEAAGSHAECVALIERDPAEAERLYLYTVTDNLNPSDPREVDFDRWVGPVKGSAVAELKYGERWYRLGNPEPVVQVFPNAILAGACITGDAAAFDAAIAAGADPHWRDSSESCMGIAIRHGRLDMVDRLIAAGWSGRQGVDGGWEVLPAVEYGHVEIVERILSLGFLDSERLSRLIGYSCDTAMAERLRAAGADPAWKFYDGELPSINVVRYKADKGEPPRIANAASLIQWFDEHGADIATVSKNGVTMLHTAVWCWNPIAIRQLLAMGAPLDVVYQYTNETPEMAADKAGRGDEFRALLAECQPREERAPIHYREPQPEPEPEPDTPLPVSVTSDAPPEDEEPEPGSPDGTAGSGHARALALGGAVVGAAGVAMLLLDGSFALGLVLVIAGLALLAAGISRSRTKDILFPQLPPATPAVLRSGSIRSDDYPSRALRAELEGKVLVEIRIEPDGRPSQVRVLRSSGHDILDRATCDIITRRFRYHPARDEGGNAVRQVLQQSVTWTL